MDEYVDINKQYYDLLSYLIYDYGYPNNFNKLKDINNKWNNNEIELKIALKSYGKNNIINILETYEDEYGLIINKDKLNTFLNINSSK